MFYVIAATIGCFYGALIFVPLFYPLKLTSAFEVRKMNTEREREREGERGREREGTGKEERNREKLVVFMALESSCLSSTHK
jgi:hypothetical protein